MLMSAQDFIRWRMFAPLVFAVVLVIAGLGILFKKDQESNNNYTNYQNYNDSNNNNKSAEYTEYKNNQQANNSGMNGNESAPGSEYTTSSEHIDEAGAYEKDTSDNTFNQRNREYSNFNNNSNNNSYNSNSYTNYNSNYSSNTGNGYCACTAVLSGKDLRFDHREFRGAVLSAVLGGIEMDLRNAIIRDNVVIDAKAILGGIDIYVPNYVRVEVDCAPILGGIDNKSITPMNADSSTPVIFIKGTCVLGGIDVK